MNLLGWLRYAIARLRPQQRAHHWVLIFQSHHMCADCGLFANESNTGSACNGRWLP